MPEGDTIWRAARRIRDSMLGATVTTASSSASPALGLIEGATLDEVVSRGKHILLGLSGGKTIHTHLGMHGSWKVTRANRPMTARVAGTVLSPKWLVLETGALRAVCERAVVVELLDTANLKAHPVLSALGPDILDPGAAAGPDALARASAKGRETIGEMLLDQHVVAGIGNIYRCETLFVCGIHPETRVASLSEDELRTTLDTASRLMTSNLERRTRPWVYRRAGLPCLRCGSLVRSGRLGTANARTVYWCPHCQPARSGG